MWLKERCFHCDYKVFPVPHALPSSHVTLRRLLIPIRGSSFKPKAGINEIVICMNCHDLNDKLNCNFHTFHPVIPSGHCLAISASFVVSVLTCIKDLTETRGLGFKGGGGPGPGDAGWWSWLRPLDRHVQGGGSNASKDELLGSGRSLTNEDESYISLLIVEPGTTRDLLSTNPFCLTDSALGSLGSVKVQEHHLAELTSHASCLANTVTAPHTPASRLATGCQCLHSNNSTVC